MLGTLRQRIKGKNSASAGKGFNSRSHYKFCAQVYLHASSNEHTRCQSSGGKKGQARKIASMANDQKGRGSKKVIKETQKEQRTVRFAALMDICHVKNAELEPKFQKYKGPVVL